MSGPVQWKGWIYALPYEWTARAICARVLRLSSARRLYVRVDRQASPPKLEWRLQSQACAPLRAEEGEEPWEQLGVVGPAPEPEEVLAYRLLDHVERRYDPDDWDTPTRRAALRARLRRLRRRRQAARSAECRRHTAACRAATQARRG